MSTGLCDKGLFGGLHSNLFEVRENRRQGGQAGVYEGSTNIQPVNDVLYPLGVKADFSKRG
jgi:hypothetical protein